METISLLCKESYVFLTNIEVFIKKAGFLVIAYIFTLDTLYYIVRLHKHVLHFFGSPAEIIDILPLVSDYVNLSKCLLTDHHKIQ